MNNECPTYILTSVDGLGNTSSLLYSCVWCMWWCSHLSVHWPLPWTYGNPLAVNLYVTENIPHRKGHSKDQDAKEGEKAVPSP